MKKFYNFLFVVALPALFILLTSETMFHTGSPGGKSGSPGDGGSTCTDCHAGTAMVQEFWIYSPELLTSGYLPNTTYSMIVIGVDSEAQAFGFEATAEDENGNKVGTFGSGFGGLTQTLNNSKAITHTALGSIPLADTGTGWFFSWISPPEAVGDITFYAAINAANGNGANSGDQIYTSTFETSPSTGIADRFQRNALGIYPNPSQGIIHLDEELNLETNLLRVHSLNGQVVHQQRIADQRSSIDLSFLEKGVYLVTLGEKNQRLIIK